jgi:putative PIN family toxin of toxin-antitoxin system
MKIILDTNVFVSGIFFSGPPYQILKAWRDENLKIILSPSIRGETFLVADELSAKFQEIDLLPFLQLLLTNAEIIAPPRINPVIADDLSDIKFLECALAGKADFIKSGDKHLLKLISFAGIPILKTADFFNKYPVPRK